MKGSVPGHVNSFLMLKEARKKPKGYVKPVHVSPKAKKGAAKAGAKK